MKIIFKHGEGLVSMEVKKPQGQYLEWKQEYQDKMDLFLIPNMNDNFTDIVETATVEEINSFNKEKLEEINRMQFEELSKTDWHYTRFLELGIEVPIEILNERKEIREKYNNLKQ
jgi:hypothetical protein